LRKVGRAIVDMAAPTESVPAQLQEVTGASTIQFFKESPEIKYNFDMNAHMNELFACSRAQFASHDTWLTTVVFKTILFTPQVESAFREKLATILNMDPESNYEIAFKDMLTREPFMLELLTVLKGIQYNYAFFLRYKLILSNLLKPLKEQIKKTTITPSAIYVGVRTKPDGLYDETTKKALFPGFAKALLQDNKKVSEVDEKRRKMIVQLDDKKIQLDDAVSEEIGRILLEYEAKIDDKRLAGGGSTRKRKRVCRLKNARTRSKTGLINGKKRVTRKKRRASNIQCKRTRRV